MVHTMKAIILLGAPGAGKGTAAERLKKLTAFQHVSTGDMLRAAVREGTPVGLQAKAHMDRGELVPDAVILGIVKERMQRDGAGAQYMFDGFPRTLEQARALDGLIAAAGGEMRGVFLLDVPADLILRRLTGRRVCRKCGAVYNIHTMPTRVSGICDQCGGETYQRDDDQEATIRNRLEVYGRQTGPLMDYYRARNCLVSVKADRAMDEVCAEIVAHLKA